MRIYGGEISGADWTWIVSLALFLVVLAGIALLAAPWVTFSFAGLVLGVFIVARRLPPCNWR